MRGGLDLRDDWRQFDMQEKVLSGLVVVFVHSPLPLNTLPDIHLIVPFPTAV